MSVKRNFFPNAPSGSVDALQRVQIVLGWPFQINQPVPPAPIVYTSYIRSYLGDNDNVISQGLAPEPITSTTSSYLNYIRSFLGDN